MAQRQSVTVNGRTWFYSAAASAYPSLVAGGSYTGASGVNTQFSSAGNDRMTGGGGGSDNTFYAGSTDTVVAGLGDGVDTIISYWGSLTLPKGIADGVVRSDGTLTGNSGDNILTVTGTGVHTLNGAGGNDLLIGATGGADRFVLSKANGGTATIMGFEHGTDVTQLDGFTQFSSFAAVQSAMSQVGTSVVVTLGGGQSMTFANDTVGRFTARDFQLPFTPNGTNMTFDDEFNSLSASATGVGTTWRTMSGTLSNNHEAENYVTNTGPNNPFSVANGVLAITASPVSTAAGLSYTSGGLITKDSFSQTYGYFEMRAQMPAGAGMWPAFWLMPADGTWPPELDAPEVLGNDPTTIYVSTHSTVQASQTLAVKVADTSKGFHTYGVDWEPSTITYFFDGAAVATLNTPADMNKPMYLVANLAVGDKGSWPGPANGQSGTLLIDYIRAYSSLTAVQPPLVLVNWGMAINKGDGSFSVTGSGAGGRVTLGNGDQKVALTPYAAGSTVSQNTVTVGNGNHSISTVGNSNIITTGQGSSVISAGGSYNRVTVGATTPGATTRLSATGFGDTFASAGKGDVSVSGTAGSAVVTLADGNHQVSLGGSGNVVTLGAGNSVVNAGNGQAVVHVGAGSSTITVSGWNNILDAGPGNNVLNGGAGNDTFVLNGAGQGLDQINGFRPTGSDILDFSRALSGLGVADKAGFARFVTANTTAAGTTLSVDTTGHGGAGQAVALLTGVSTSVGNLLANMAIQVGTHRL